MAIYWLKAGDAGLVKVGLTDNVAKRIASLQTGCPYPMVLLRQEPGDRAVEDALHRHYRAKHARAEWFVLDAADVAVALADVMLPKPQPKRVKPAPQAGRRSVKLSTCPGIALLRAKRGALAQVSRALGMTTSAPCLWAQVPGEYVVKIEAATGIPREQLRPDLYAPRVNGVAA